MNPSAASASSSPHRALYAIIFVLTLLLVAMVALLLQTRSLMARDAASGLPADPASLELRLQQLLRREVQAAAHEFAHQQANQMQMAQQPPQPPHGGL